MKALTVRQPWASLIICGAKDIENRIWHHHFRGKIAIHSSASLDLEEIRSACELMSQFIPRFSAHRFKQDTFPCGVVLGTVEIVDCVAAHQSPWFQGPWGFVLKNPERFKEPIPAKGKLGFWEWES